MTASILLKQLKYVWKNILLNLFLKKKQHATAERITQTMNDCKIYHEINNSILQRMDDYPRKKNRYPTSNYRWLQIEWWNK